MSDMVSSATKKRLHPITEDDVNSDKKLKSSATAGVHHKDNGGIAVSVEAPPSSTVTAVNGNRSTTQGKDHPVDDDDDDCDDVTIHPQPNAVHPLKKGQASIEKPAFGSPLPAKKSSRTTGSTKNIKEETPYTSKTAQRQPVKQSQISKKGLSDSSTTVRLPQSSLQPETPLVKDEIKIHVRPGLRGHNTVILLIVLWIGSCVLLGGMLILETRTHQKRIVQLQHKLVDATAALSSSSRSDEPKSSLMSEQELLDLVKKHKMKAAESESKLQGCTWKLQDLQSRLETK